MEVRYSCPWPLESATVSTAVYSTSSYSAAYTQVATTVINHTVHYRIVACKYALCHLEQAALLLNIWNQANWECGVKQISDWPVQQTLQTDALPGSLYHAGRQHIQN